MSNEGPLHEGLLLVVSALDDALVPLLCLGHHRALAPAQQASEHVSSYIRGGPNIQPPNIGIQDIW